MPSAPYLKLLALAAPLLTFGAASPLAPPGPGPSGKMQIDCRAPSHRIDPRIYGIAYYPLTDAKDGYLWGMKPTARRWGGNHTSRYNWRLGNAWNTAADWYFRNVNYTGKKDFSWKTFLDENRRRGVATAMTMPMIGWVAKDVSSSSFPIEVYGRQQAADPHHPKAGNGIAPNGKLLLAQPSRTSVPMPPSEIEAWVRAIRAHDAKHGRRSVDFYLLDNEPELWNTTHRDVHPEPVGYDELLTRTIAYASAIRRADPDAVIAGPAAWGWPAYFYSAKDVEAGFFAKPDRRAHGDVPLLAWYLRKLAEHEKKTGVRLLDVLDVHYYPQELPRDADDPYHRARRLRATRSLWDPTYKDESWIDDRVELLPRLRRLVEENYPGLKLMIGEYNFGGERTMTGALALAEVLGRFGQEPTLTAAFYFSYPPQGSPAMHAFRAYRDYDGAGSHFLERSLRAKAPSGTSLFASRDEGKSRIVAIALNLEEKEREAVVGLEGCGAVNALRAFHYGEGALAIRTTERARLMNGQVRMHLAPRSITILEMATQAVAER